MTTNVPPARKGSRPGNIARLALTGRAGRRARYRGTDDLRPPMGADRRALPAVRAPVDLQSPAARPAMLRKTFGCFPTGVVAVCAMVDDEPAGMAASSFASVSLAPPMVLFCAAQSSLTWPRLRTARRLGLSVLSDSQAELCRQLAGPSANRFTGVDWTSTEDGTVLLGGAAAWLDCRLEREVEAGDHHVALLEVGLVSSAPEVGPLIFHQSRFAPLET